MNNIYNSPDISGTFDRKLSTTPFVSQTVAVPNAGRTYWYFEMLGDEGEMQLSIGNERTTGPGCIRLNKDNRSVDCNAIPELTQAAIFVCGNTPESQFTFIEVAAEQSTQS